MAKTQKESKIQRRQISIRHPTEKEKQKYCKQVQLLLHLPSERDKELCNEPGWNAVRGPGKLICEDIVEYSAPSLDQRSIAVVGTPVVGDT